MKTLRLSKPKKFQRVAAPELRERATGQWISILVAAGLPADLLDGKGHPCPKCGGHDRFAAFSDVDQRGSVICRHCFNGSTAKRPGDGLATLSWILGCDFGQACQWLANHLGLAMQRNVLQPNRQRSKSSGRVRLFGETHSSFKRLLGISGRALTSDKLTHLVDTLSLSPCVLDRMGVGFVPAYSASTWPMVDEHGQIIGVRFRDWTSSRKWALKGSRQGLFVPKGLSTTPTRLFIAEGPTDCAALLSLGFDCIGRPSCNGAVDMTCAFVKRVKAQECIVVADNDSNEAGQRGAQSLVRSLMLVTPVVRVIKPPIQDCDVRQWIKDGATAQDILSLVEEAEPISITIN